MKTLLLLVLLGSPCLAVRVSAQDANAEQPASPPASSPLIADVLKLSRAKVDEKVILAFVQASGGKASITASEILQLREQGVSPQIQIALLKSKEPAAEPAPPPVDPGAPKTTNAPAAEATQPPAGNPPDPVLVAQPTEYLSVASPVYVGVGSAYYPYDDGWYGIGWGFGWGLGWWGWNSCYAYGYPWYGWGYGCGYYGYHCGYVYPACGSSVHSDIHGHNHAHAASHMGNANSANAFAGKTGIAAANGASRSMVGGQAGGKSANVSRMSSPTAASGSGAAGGQPKIVQGSGQAKATAGSGYQGVSSSKVTGATRPGATPQVVGNRANPTVGGQSGPRAVTGVQSVKPSTSTYRTGQPAAPTARPSVQSSGMRVTQPARTSVRTSAVGAPNSMSTRMPSRPSMAYSGGYGGRSYASPSYAGRPTGFSGGSGVSRGYSGGSVSSSRGYSGGGSRGGYSGFSGSRGGFSGGGFSGGGRR